MKSDELRARIEQVTCCLAAPKRPLSSYQRELFSLSKALRSLCPTGLVRNSKSEEPSVLDSGIALTPYRAATCVEDHVRTAAFIRGAVLAVEESLSTGKGRPLHLIEAGCGPLGTLVIPLMVRFGPQQLKVSLVDIHQSSIDSVLDVVEKLGLSDRLLATVCGDAVETDFEPADFIMTETMNCALAQEPQVAITRHLSLQHTAATLLPSSIRLELVLLNPSLEVRGFDVAPRERVSLGTIFELTAESARTVHQVGGFLPAGTVLVPQKVEPGYGLFVTTKVTVRNGVSFADYESQITLPQPLGGVPVQLGDKLEFRYRLGRSPGLEFQVVRDCD